MALSPKQIADALKKVAETLKKLPKTVAKADPIPQKKGGPPVVGTKDDDREDKETKGVITFKDAWGAVDEVLNGPGLFDAETVAEAADNLRRIIMNELTATSDTDQADAIYDLMKEKVLSQNAPRQRLKDVNWRKRI